MRKTITLIAIVVAALFLVPASQAITDGELDGNWAPGCRARTDGGQRCTGIPMQRRPPQPDHRPHGRTLRGQARRILGDPHFRRVETFKPTRPIRSQAARIPMRRRLRPHIRNSQRVAFFLHDVGIIKLANPVPGVSQYGTLPRCEFAGRASRRNVANRTSRSRQLAMASRESIPIYVVAEKVRMVAHPKLNQINGGIVGDYSLLLSNNASTGGTCFGDSGWPGSLVGNSMVVGGVTSFGLNGTCGRHRWRVPHGSRERSELGAIPFISNAPVEK